MKFGSLAGAALAALVWALPSEVSAVAQVLFPYTVVGRAVDGANAAFDAASDVTLRISSTNGTVLAQTKVFTPGALSPWNFRLAVPVASEPVPGYAVPGDTLLMTAVKDGIVYSGLLRGDDARIGTAGASVAVRVLLSEDVNGNGIDDAYEKVMDGLMAAYGITGPYEPDADYDGDHATNRDEYMAGTSPFDGDDYFGFGTSLFDTADPRFLKVRFETEAGRTYVLKESADLADGEAGWAKGVFLEDPLSGVQTIRLVNSRGTWEERTVYLIRKGPQRFYRLELEEKD